MITSASIVDAYFLLNIWLGIAYIVARFFLSLPYVRNHLTQQWRLALARLTFLLAAITPFIAPKIISWLPFKSNLSFQLKPFLHHASTTFISDSQITTWYKPVSEFSISMINLYDIGLILIMMGMLIFLYRYIKSVYAMRSLLRKSYQRHAINRIHVMFSTDITVPCCWRFLSHSYVMLPTHLLENKTDLQLALRHELQHLRQGDAMWLHVFAFFKLLCFFNPLFIAFIRWFDELHEFACDEALILRRNAMPSAYGECLLNAAKMVLVSGASNDLYFTTQQLTNPYSQSILNRRILMLFHYQKQQSKRSVLWIIGVVLMALSSMTAYATCDRALHPLSVSQVAAMLQQSDSRNELGITVTPEVVAQINQIRANNEAREFMRASIRRMAAYKPYISSQLQARDMPDDLLALPLAESGYQPLPENSVHSAGIWQFIPSTALHYGLVVNSQQDERFNSIKVTKAALDYLSKLHSEFKDWNLAIMAYNQGEDEIHRLISKTGQSNAWQIIRSSDGNSELKKYLPSVHAAAIIMHNPELV